MVNTGDALLPPSRKLNNRVTAASAADNTITFRGIVMKVVTDPESATNILDVNGASMTPDKFFAFYNSHQTCALRKYTTL